MSKMLESGLTAARISAEHYTRAVKVELTDIDLRSGRITGFAAPASGSRPCALILLAGEQIISIARAVRFSAAADDAGVRRGWCGFAISGLGHALAVGGDIQLRCLVSNDLLAQWSPGELASVFMNPPRTFLSVVGLREMLGGDGGCVDYKHVLPFAVDLGRRQGSKAVLEATYRYLLLRQLDSVAEASYSDELVEPGAIGKIWKTIMASSEYRLRRIVTLPGPFDTGFVFPLEGLDLATSRGI